MQFMAAFVRLKINLHLSTPLRGGGAAVFKSCWARNMPHNCHTRASWKRKKNIKLLLSARRGSHCITTRRKIGNNFMSRECVVRLLCFMLLWMYVDTLWIWCPLLLLRLNQNHCEKFGIFMAVASKRGERRTWTLNRFMCSWNSVASKLVQDRHDRYCCYRISIILTESVTRKHVVKMFIHFLCWKRLCEKKSLLLTFKWNILLG